MYIFDKQRALADLDSIGADGRVVFALLAATRLKSGGERFFQDDLDAITGFRFAHEKIWAAIEGAVVLSGEEIAELIARCEELIPDEDSIAGADYGAYADDAIAALIYAYRCLDSREPQEALWAAQRAYDSADLWAIRELRRQGKSVPQDEGIVLSHPVVQTELARQSRDLQELVAVGKNRVPVDRVRSLRLRAERESAVPA